MTEPMYRWIFGMKPPNVPVEEARKIRVQVFGRLEEAEEMAAYILKRFIAETRNTNMEVVPIACEPISEEIKYAFDSLLAEALSTKISAEETMSVLLKGKSREEKEALAGLIIANGKAAMTTDDIKFIIPFELGMEREREEHPIIKLVEAIKEKFGDVQIHVMGMDGARVSRAPVEPTTEEKRKWN